MNVILILVQLSNLGIMWGTVEWQGLSHSDCIRIWTEVALIPELSAKFHRSSLWRFKPTNQPTHKLMWGPHRRVSELRECKISVVENKGRNHYTSCLSMCLLYGLLVRKKTYYYMCDDLNPLLWWWPHFHLSNSSYSVFELPRGVRLPFESSWWKKSN